MRRERGRQQRDRRLSRGSGALTWPHCMRRPRVTAEVCAQEVTDEVEWCQLEAESG